MQAHSFSIKDALLFPFQLFTRNPLIMLSIALAMIITLITTVIVGGTVFLSLSSLYGQSSTSLTLALFVLRNVATWWFSFWISVIAFESYTIASPSITSVASYIKQFPAFCLAICIYGFIPDILAYSVPLYITGVIASIIFSVRFGLVSYVLLDKKNGLHAFKDNWMLSEGLTLKLLWYFAIYSIPSYALILLQEDYPVASILFVPMLIIAMFSDMHVYRQLSQ